MKESLHNIKLKLDDFYFNNNKITLAVGRLIFALCIFFYINTTLGAFQKLSSPIVSIILSALSIVLPLPIIMLMAFGLIALHIFKISIVLLAGYIVILSVMFLLVFRICPDKWIVVFATLILFGIRMPYLVPLLLGIVFSSSIVVPGLVATILALFLDMASKYKVTTEVQSISAISETYSSFAKDGFIIMWLIAIGVTIIVISIVKTLNIKNSKEIALIFGGFIQIVLLIGLKIILNVDINILLTVVLGLLSIIISIVVLWAFFPFNYKATEYVEFFDDEYYYFVRAVPISKNRKRELLNIENSVKNKRGNVIKEETE